ncbi:antibiotic biosynthesis monooxygenase family protein [Histidinibacterium aquaticum]|uniref:Antibiotic biosynthesis monooxygenase n=1 Tax=Histidinibacterium aquaticum TaxID=2613962 RepID=A0A5J5GNI9_9RHOB|nr:antibiotic biosynthesis monooxygenase [Histidinibacterium aquaticum]KAA9009138.1 antibiotic biosynthesis monooxygenase [Histidinibacterium aquaticum]
MTCLTMNRFKVLLGQEEAFEEVWRSRESHLKEVDGFEAFHLMRGDADEAEGYRLYASHTLWRDRAAFEAWTKSDAFRAAHSGVRPQSDLYAGPPELETFDSVEGVG